MAFGPSVPTNADVVRRSLYQQSGQDPGQWERASGIYTMIIGIRGSRWRAGCQSLAGSLSTRRLGLRQPHRYQNRDRVSIRLMASSGLIQRARKGGIGLGFVKNGFSEVREEDGRMEEDKQKENSDVEKEMVYRRWA